MNKEKISKIKSILRSEQIDAWMLISQDNRDPFFTKLIAPNIYSLTVALFTQNESVVFCSSLDKESVEHYAKNSTVYTHSRNKEETLIELLAKYIEENGIKKIALNYSTMKDINIDILGYGMYSYFTNTIIDKVDYIDEKSFISAESIVYALTDSKDDSEIDKMKIAANRALEILKLAFKNIEAGMTEVDLANMVHKITEKTRSKFIEKFNGEIISEAYSWEEDMCPIVLVGKSFTKGGHAVSSDNAVNTGNTIYFDFGICLTFKDGTKWSSDIQRTGYMLKDAETEPPQYIKDRFKTIVESIKLGMDSIKIGMKGYELDNIVRSYIIGKGYPDYDHGTGHAIGELAHNPGTNFTMSKSGTGNLKVQPNGVYTIEPRISLENGVSVEEMVAVLENGSVETLCERQTDIILINSTNKNNI